MLETQIASYEGAHSILDLWVNDSHIKFLTDKNYMETILKEACIIAGATIISSNFHSFGKDFGLTGLILLAESHASCHTFPERSYIAFDMFTCGKCNPNIAMDFIINQFSVKRSSRNFLLRGIDNQYLSSSSFLKHQCSEDNNF